jgi:hypothetical protein
MARDQRRLAAIVSADVAGYSRLMGRDESGTLTTLKAHRRELRIIFPSASVSMWTPSVRSGSDMDSPRIV